MTRKPDYTDHLEELQVTLAVRWQLQEFGSYFQSLFKAITLADESNLRKLQVAYPYETQAVLRYRTEVAFAKRVNEVICKRIGAAEVV